MDKQKTYTLFCYLGFLVLYFLPTQIVAQDCGALACNGQLQISIGVECDMAIEADMLLEAPSLPISEYEVELYNEDDEFIGNSVTAAEINTTLKYKVINTCDGNSCWGNIVLESNILPVLESPCQFIAGHEVVVEENLSASNSPLTVKLNSTDDCQKVISLMGTSALKYNSGTHTSPIWSYSDLQVDIFESNGLQIYSNTYGNGAFSDIITIPGNGTYTLEFSSVISQANGDLMIKAAVPECQVGCFGWCGGGYPEKFLTYEDAKMLVDSSCGAVLIGDIIVQESSVGDLCNPDGVLHIVTYSATVTMHGMTQKVVLLTQAYREEKIDISPNGFAEIRFPEPSIIDCDVEVNGEHELCSPEWINQATKDHTLAYPSYVDFHTFVPDTTIVDSIVHIVEIAGYRDTMIVQQLDLDGDGVFTGEWVIVTVVDKIFRDSIVYDTLIGPGVSNPLIPIKPGVAFCNLVTTYSDLEISICAGGKKLIRDWTIIDWCDSGSILTGIQQVEISDHTAPEVEALDDVIKSVDPWTCSARFELPTVEYIDNCSSEVSVSWRATEGVITNGYITDLWENQSPITVTAIVADECGNATETSFNIAVRDEIPPVMVCKTGVSVTLTYSQGDPNSGVAKIYAESLDVGSHDAGCGDISFEVARMTGCCGAECGDSEIICLKRDKFGDCIEEGVQPQEDEYGDFVKFCCEDAGQIIQVVLVGIDDSGNKNQCMVSVVVVDNAVPTMVCEEIDADCDENIDEISAPNVLGLACGAKYEAQLIGEGTVDGNCGEDKITREWFIDMDGSGDLTQGDPYCKQIINIGAKLGFDPYTIKWPKHYNNQIEDGINLECDRDGELDMFVNQNVNMGDAMDCVPDFEVDDIKPVWCSSDCGLVGYSLTQDTIFSSDACMTIINKWSVVDWCQYNANDTDAENNQSDRFEAVEDWAQGDCVSCPTYPEANDPVYFRYNQVLIDGFYSFNQIIKIQDDTAPKIAADESITVNTTGGATTKDDDSKCVGSALISASAIDFCGANMTSSDELNWTITVYENDILESRVRQTGPIAEVNSGEGSPGDVHRIEWAAEDGCGNVDKSTTLVTFSDEKAPTPICIAGLTTTFMESSGTVELWANDYDLGSFDNCTDASDLSFTIVREGDEPQAFGSSGFDNEKSISFSCSSMESFITLQIYVWDADGNSDYCNVGILINDSNNYCPEDQNDCIDTNSIDPNADCGDEIEPVCGCNGKTYQNVCLASNDGVLSFNQGPCENGSFVSIGGSVSTDFGEIISNVEIELKSSLPEFPKLKSTDGEGHYMFSNNQTGVNYQLGASKDDSYENGVSTFDIVLIQKHILGVTLFNNPYKVIAADVNGNETVSGSDLVGLTKRVLGAYAGEMQEDAWSFVKTSQQFFDYDNPWPLIHTSDLINIYNNKIDEDFIGVKIGDVSNDVSVNGHSSAKKRSNKTLELLAQDRKVAKGERIKIAISADYFAKTYGMQFTLSHESLDLVDIASAGLEIQDYNYLEHDGMTTFSWYDVQSDVQSGELFILEFEATEDVIISEVLNLNSKITAQEAYQGEELDLLNVSLSFKNKADAVSNILAISPNPMSDLAKLDINIGKEQIINLKIIDAAGRVIWEDDRHFNSGKHIVNISRQQLTGPGIYYIQLSTDQIKDVEKLLVIE